MKHLTAGARYWRARLSPGLPRQPGFGKPQAQRPHPTTADECLWISPVAGHTDDANLLIKVFKSPRPFGVVKIRVHPAVRDRIMDRETILPAGRQFCQRVDAPAERRRVVNVAVLDDRGGPGALNSLSAA